MFPQLHPTGADSIDPFDLCYLSSQCRGVLDYIVVVPDLFCYILCRSTQNASSGHSVLRLISFLADHRLNWSTGDSYSTISHHYKLFNARPSRFELKKVLPLLILWIDPAKSSIRSLSNTAQMTISHTATSKPICQNPTARTENISALLLLRFAVRMDCSVTASPSNNPSFLENPQQKRFTELGSVERLGRRTRTGPHSIRIRQSIPLNMALCASSSSLQG